MERFFAKVAKPLPTSTPTNELPTTKDTLSISKDALPITNDEVNGQSGAKRNHIEIDMANLPWDPALRKPIAHYDVNEREMVRRAYLQRGPCRPRGHNFKRYKPDSKKHPGCGDAFVENGFTNWKKRERLVEHVGRHDSAHNEAWRNCQALMNYTHHIEPRWNKKTKQDEVDYRTRLTASLNIIRVLLRNRLPFRGHDESIDSSNQGLFLELLKFLATHNEEVAKVVFDNSPGNLKLTSPDIQKDIVSACASETTKKIMKEIGNSFFSILVDEARDVSTKEQMAIVLRYVDKHGHVIERFVGIVHVKSTKSISLKEALDNFLSEHNLSISNARGQGYDGASNMRGEFNGLKALILKENPCAYYVHCFAHQLQLALVAIAKKNLNMDSLFDMVTKVVHHVGSSSKRNDILIDAQAIKVAKEISSLEIPSGRGLNQETCLKRSGDTRWSSHYNSLLRLIGMFSSVIEVLEILKKEPSQNLESSNLLDALQTYDFAFSLHLMTNILAITHDLSQALQRKNQDIVNAMELVKLSKQRLQKMRDEGWDSLLNQVSLFCVDNYIEVPNMDDVFVLRGRSRRNIEKSTYLHHFSVEVFYPVVDMQLQELNDRFSEAHTDLLVCMAALDPSHSFSRFDKEKLIHLATLYPNDFSENDLLLINNQLETYILDVKSNDKFLELKGVGALANMMVLTRKNEIYQLVYRLVVLTLTLPVATATVERAFSAMNLVKSNLRNRMGDKWMADCLLTYVEKDIFDSIDNEPIMQYYQKMKNRGGNL